MSGNNELNNYYNEMEFWRTYTQYSANKAAGKQVLIIGSQEPLPDLLSLLEQKGCSSTVLLDSEIEPPVQAISEGQVQFVYDLSEIDQSLSFTDVIVYSKITRQQSLAGLFTLISPFLKEQTKLVYYYDFLTEDDEATISELKDLSLEQKLSIIDTKILDEYVFFTSEVNPYIKVSEEPEETEVGKWLRVTQDILSHVKEKYQDVEKAEGSESNVDRFIEAETLKKMVSYRLQMKELEGMVSHLERQIGKEQQKQKKLKNLLDKSNKVLAVHKENASARYRIGDAIINSMRSPRKMLGLPRTLYRIYKQTKNGEIVPRNASSQQQKQEKVQPISETKETIVFVPTNGAGLGHLTRLLAIARRVKKLDPNKEIVFHTTSSAMHLILQEGFLGYHLPSKMLFPKEMTAKQWNQMLHNHLNDVIDLHQPEMIVFDGAFPYAGLVSSMRKDEGIKKYWVKRGQHKEGTAELVSEKEKYFDRILVPGEAGASGNMETQDKVVHSEPVIYLDKEELVGREIVRKKWNIPEGAKLVYVQLGAGNINDINSTISILLRELTSRENVYVVVGESIIGTRIAVDMERVMTIRDYPNSMYFGAFDLAISATGYNTFHELMYFGVPSIFLPNENTKTDDQVARANIAGDAGAAIVLRDPSEDDFKEAIDRALDPEVNEQMRESTKKLVQINGADQIARKIVES
ncbi:glycosyltransferase [Thalassorhabdus alkalitolerans]|uniref:Glycosyltransferase n=1 Tax=Thalassorhabdus alkalitolerans TaxID=2282697 RepID=A0ABW0YL59_9BACI